jgi:hypothetical protein
MKTRWVYFVLGLVGAAALMGVGHTIPSPGVEAVQADETAAPRVVLADTYNAVTRVHFTPRRERRKRMRPAQISFMLPLSRAFAKFPAIAQVLPASVVL